MNPLLSKVVVVNATIVRHRRITTTCVVMLQQHFTKVQPLSSSIKLSSVPSSSFSSTSVSDADHNNMKKKSNVTNNTFGKQDESIIPASSSTTSFADTSSSTSSLSSVSQLRQQILHQAMENIKMYGLHETNLIQNTTIQILQQVQENDDESTSHSQRRNNNSISYAIMGMITIPDVIQYTIQHCNNTLLSNISMTHQQQQSSSQHQDNDNNTVAFTQNTSTTDIIMRCIQQRILLLHYITTSITTTTTSSSSSSHHAAFIARSLQLDCISATQSQIITLIQSILQSQQQHIPTTIDIMTISAIYVATELHFLSDTSNNYNTTWQFLQNQLLQWESFHGHHKTYTPPKSSTLDLFSIASSLLSTSIASTSVVSQMAKNILTSSTTTILPNAVTSSSSTSKSFPNLFQYHTPSDIAFTMHIFGTALTSGLYSLLVPPISISSSSPAPIGSTVQAGHTAPVKTTTTSIAPPTSVVTPVVSAEL